MRTTSFHNRLFAIAFTSILIATFSLSTANGQARTFKNKSVDYVIEFPSARWRALPPSGIVPPRTRKTFRYAEGNVWLILRRKFVHADISPSDMVRRRQGWAQHQLAGYVSGKEESFSGKLNGAKFSYEYVRGGKTISALIYYLETDNRTIYSLLFSGPTDELRSIGNQTDSIARSFRLKNSFRF
jgi:hypothetical protein